MGLWVLPALAALCLDAAAIEVEISGLAPELEENVRDYLSIAELNDEEAAADEAAREGDEAENDVPESRVRRLHAAASDEIAVALQPFGYYDPSVESSLERSDDTWVARYRVNPGRRTFLTEVEIRVVGEGADSEPLRSALAAIRLPEGVALHHPQYQAAKDMLFDAAYGAGYIDASYQRAELRVNRSTREASAHLVLDTGPRYYFGDVTIEQDILNDSFIQRYVTIERGDPFDTDRLVSLQITLNDSGYFNDVAVDVEREEAIERHIPVVVHTTPRPTQDYTLGLGYGTDTGPRLSIGAELRRLNRRGHRFNADMRLSNIEQAVAAEYRIPARNPATDFLALRGSLGNHDIGDWDTRQLAVGATWHDAWRRVQRRIYVSAEREEFSTELTAPMTEDAVYGGIQITRQDADDPLYPRRGHSWSADLRAGAEALLSSTSFARLHVTGNFVRSLGARIRFLLRAEYGAIRADEFGLLPPSQRFYAGGDRSVRGYGYQDLGPVDVNGHSIGGRYMLVASAEMEFMIVGDYGAAIFADVGNAANDAWPDLQRGVGVGLRWRSPIGVVGVDVAHPLDDPDTDYRLHLSVGADL
ncbi:MAG: outer membrane protein assembly factor [Gammaproteobacteria bacterium]|nr:outer membrane protein assembly factor [Gammaproteobacteria bacterium]